MVCLLWSVMMVGWARLMYSWGRGGRDGGEEEGRGYPGSYPLNGIGNSRFINSKTIRIIGVYDHTHTPLHCCLLLVHEDFQILLVSHPHCQMTSQTDPQR